MKRMGLTNKLLHDEGVFAPWFLDTFLDAFVCVCALAAGVGQIAEIDQTRRWGH